MRKEKFLDLMETLRMKRKKFVIFYRKQNQVYKYIVKAAYRQNAIEMFTRSWPMVDVTGITTLRNYRKALNRP